MRENKSMVEFKKIKSIFLSVLFRMKKQKRKSEIDNNSKTNDFFVNNILDPETPTRKNLEFFILLLISCIGIYFAYTANTLSVKYGEQQDQIVELKRIAQKLNSQDSIQHILLSQAFEQTNILSKQYTSIVKIHSNDSLNFLLTSLKPNIQRMRDAIASIDHDNSHKYRIKNNILSNEIYEKLIKLSKNVLELLENPVFMIHQKELTQCYEKRPHPASLLFLISENGILKQDQFGKECYYYRDTSSINNINKEIERFGKQKLEFVTLVSSFYNQWYKTLPK